MKIIQQCGLFFSVFFKMIDQYFQRINVSFWRLTLCFINTVAYTSAHKKLTYIFAFWHLFQTDIFDKWPSLSPLSRSFIASLLEKKKAMVDLLFPRNKSVISLMFHSSSLVGLQAADLPPSGHIQLQSTAAFIPDKSNPAWVWQSRLLCQEVIKVTQTLPRYSQQST